MDADQVESAGIHNHNHNHSRISITDTPRSSVGGGGEDSWARALLRRGWVLSRKAAIAGAAATAAPVVAPPLIVLSAAGIVLSVPFAAYLATLAATNHLMGALFPPSPAQPYHTCEQEDEDVGEEFLDASEEDGKDAPAFGHWNQIEEGTINEEKENGTSLVLSRDPGVSEAQLPTLAEEIKGESSIHESGHESLASNSGDKAEEATTMQENEFTTKEPLPQGFDVSESAEPLLQYEDNVNVVQRKGEDEVIVQESGQESFESKNWNKKEDGTTMAENKSTNFDFSESPMPLQGDVDNVIQGDRDREFSIQNLGRDLLLSNSGDKTEDCITIEEKKSTKDMPPRDFVVSESSVPVFHGEDNVVQSEREVQISVTLQGVMEEVNSNTDLVTVDVVDVQLQIVTTAVPGRELLPQSNFVACDSPADIVTGEVVNVQVDIVAAAPPESDVLAQSNPAACESATDVMGEIKIDVPVDTAAAAVPESEVLPLSNLAACESQAVVETAYDGDIVGITVMENIVRDSGDVNKECVERHSVSVASVVNMHGEDVMSGGSSLYVSAIGDEMIDQANQEACVGYTVMNERFGRNIVAGDEIQYTEEQLREQLDTIRTITGYRAVPCSTLEGELAGLYIFVGVEPPVSSRDTSDVLMELNAKLQFLKSIIGVD